MLISSCDVAIVGGGMVGASLAVALSPLPLNVVLIESFPFGDDAQPGYDDRSIALSYGSSRILQGMGIWSALKDQLTAIASIHVSDRGHYGATRMSAAQQKVPALGYLVESRSYGSVLKQVLDDTGVDVLQPASVTSLVSDDLEKSNDVVLNIECNGLTQQLNAGLVVACDGANSKLRELAGISHRKYDYNQVAIVANVSPDRPHNGKAFERFTENGPIALLPLSQNRCSLVWTLHPDELEATMALDDQAFLNKLNRAFGYRLGRFIQLGRRSSFPLVLTEAEQMIAQRTAVVGNAAHALHPVAGQGLNLALRDIADLAELLAKASAAGADIGGDELLADYAKHRKSDVQRTIRYTDSLVKLFSSDAFLLGHARAAGLSALDRIPALRGGLAKQSMGLVNAPSRLARGLPLQAQL